MVCEIVHTYSVWDSNTRPPRLTTSLLADNVIKIRAICVRSVYFCHVFVCSRHHYLDGTLLHVVLRLIF